MMENYSFDDESVRIAERLVHAIGEWAGIVFEDAVAWAAGIDVRNAPPPWFQPAEDYGERAWRLAGKEVAVICHDCGNGWMSVLTLEPLAPVTGEEFRSIAARFFSRLDAARQDARLNGGHAI